MQAKREAQANAAGTPQTTDTSQTPVATGTPVAATGATNATTKLTTEDAKK